MATLYWGGGTGTWDGFTATNWYTDLARTVLAGRAPAADDDVIFDATSNATAYTVTLANSTPVCRNCTISGPASGNLTLAGAGQWYIYGSLTLPATGLTRTFTSGINFYGSGSHTITTNGVALGSGITFSGTGTYILQDALNNGTFQILINAGTFDTNGKNLTCGNINATAGVTAGTLTLGASTVSAAAILANAPLIINSGTSSITFFGAGAIIGNGTNYTGNTFYNVTFSSNAVTTCSIYGNNTFNNLTFTTPAAARISNVALFGNQTVNGTLTIAGQSGANRYFVRSNLTGTARTLTVAAIATLTDVDFRDITVAGASAPWSGTRLGDCKGNTNITFSAGANKYIAAATGSSNWSADIWAASSGGAASVANFPLAQDTVIIDDSGITSGSVLTLNVTYNIGGLDASSRTVAMTFSGNVAAVWYGSNIVSTNVSFSSAVAWIYAGRSTQNITTNGKSWAGITVDSPGGEVILLDNMSMSSRSISLVNGAFNANNKNITAGDISASGSGSKTLTLGSGTITLSANGIFATTAVPNLTVTANTATINSSSGGNFGFEGVTASFGGTITVNGASSNCIIYGTTTIGNLTIANAPTATGASEKLQLFGNLTVTGTLALAGGTSAIQRMFVRSDTLGTQRTLSAATVTGLTDIDFRDINATGAANWTTGTRLGDCGGNAGITFPAAKTVYWNLAGTQNWSATAWAPGSGGTPAVNNFPLAQDTAVFDNTGSVGTVTMNANWNIGTISAGSRTSAWTLDGGSTPTVYGDVTYGSGLTASFTGGYTFSGRGTQTFITAGKSVINPLTVNKPAGTFQHGDAYTGTGNIVVTLGNYTTQNYNINAPGILSSNTNTRSITLGTSTVTATGTGPINFANPTGLTFSGASSTILSSNAGNRTFSGGGQTFGTVTVTGGTTASLTAITGSNTFGTLSNTAYTQLRFDSGATQTVSTFTFTGASGNVVRWYTNIPGQRATIKTVSSAAGANSINGGNNTGLTFGGSSPDYFYVKDIAYSQLAIPSTANFLMFFN